MIVQAFNKMNNGDISRIDVKFNKNYLEIQPTTTVPLNGNISANSNKLCNLTLQLSEDPTPKQQDQFDPIVASAKPPVTMFATTIPVEIFFDNNNNNNLNERNSFLGEWRSIPNTEDQSQTLKQCKNNDINVVKDIFIKNQCSYKSGISLRG